MCCNRALSVRHQMFLSQSNTGTHLQLASWKLWLTTFALLICILSLSDVRADNRLILGGIQGSINQRIGAAILKEAYASIGIDVTFQLYPARRSLIESNTGTIDGEVQRIDNINIKYPNLVQVPVPLFNLVGAIYTKTKSFEIKGWESLQPYMVGILLTRPNNREVIIGF